MSGKQVERVMAPVVETSMSRVWAAQASKVSLLLPPWGLWLVLLAFGGLLHVLFGDGRAAAWSAVGTTLCTVVVTGLTWLVAHARSPIGRVMSTATAAGAGLWLTAATIVGPWSPVVAWFWLVGGATLAACWNIRAVIRTAASDSGADGSTDVLAALFDRTKSRAKLDGATVTTTVAGDRKIEADMQLPAGEKTVADIQKRTEYIEGAMQVPPGTITISADLDDASRAKVTVSDPRVMRNPIPWPGPSRPGASVAEPIRPGVWQDLDDVEYTLTGHHVQVMGMSGSGKSIGCLWNVAAELVTRHDVALFGIDLVKGMQTFGPLVEGMHRVETSEGGARALVAELADVLAARTDHLSAGGRVKWSTGCGLTYLVLWIEEAWRLFEVLSSREMEQFEALLKAIRSAGGTVVISLQRGDHTQMPTMVAGQTARWCFGLGSSHDARWGLSERQIDAGASPEMWGTNQPGMSYLDAPGLDEMRIAMPMRTFDWAENVAAIRAHMAAHPAAARPLDAITAHLSDAGRPEEDQTDGDGGDDEGMNIPTPDPDPTVTGDLDDPIEDQADEKGVEFTRPEPAKATPDQARALLYATIRAWSSTGRATFATRDAVAVIRDAGMTQSRSWVQKQLRGLLDDGALGYDDEQREFIIRTREPA